MKGRKHTPEQVVRKLREGDRLMAEGKTVAEVAKALEISEHTFSRWRNQYGGMKADDAIPVLLFPRFSLTTTGAASTPYEAVSHSRERPPFRTHKIVVANYEGVGRDLSV